MSEKNTKLPANLVETLTILYMQNQDLSNVSPEKLVDVYINTSERIASALPESDGHLRTFKRS